MQANELTIFTAWCRSASVVRLGVLEATSSEVQALHIDTLSGCRADEEKSAVSALGLQCLSPKS